jgi:hypothetical protein
MDNRLQDHYVVIKIDKMTTEQRKYLELFLLQQRIDDVKAVVIEQDWPEYTPTVDMLMGRILREGKEAPKFPPPSTMQSQCQRFAQCTMGFGHLGPCREQGVIHQVSIRGVFVCSSVMERHGTKHSCKLPEGHDGLHVSRAGGILWS